VECQEQGLQQQNKKMNSNEHLFRKYRERFPDADKNELIKKFNSLHTNFRKELKRIQDSEEKKCVTGAHDVVEPKLWYFEEMKFLISQEEPCTSLNTLQKGEEGEQESDKLWIGGIASRIVAFLFSIRGVIMFSRPSNYVASSRRKF
jgi:hypothetical protein